MLVCDLAYMDGKKIMCRKTEKRCGHVKICQLTMKEHQTEQARECPLRGEK